MWIAENERQALYLLALDDVANLGIVQVERRNLFAVDRDCFGGRTRDQRRAEVLDLAHGKFHSRILHGLEARSFDEPIIHSWNPTRDPIVPRPVGHSAAHDL